MARIGNPFRPIFVMFQEGVSRDQVLAVMSGIRSVLEQAKAGHLIQVSSLGVWRQLGYREAGQLQPYKSVDWYVAKGFEKSRNNSQANSGEILTQLWIEPWQDQIPHYEVVVLCSDLYSEETNFVIGSAIKGFGTVISINRFRDLERNLQLECIRTEVTHEVGHVFGLVPETRTVRVNQSLGLHCTNQCVMRQGLTVPLDWIQFSKERLATSQIFCPQCQQDLRNYFH
jgi:predicted Zn-dependent protease